MVSRVEVGGRTIKPVESILEGDKVRKAWNVNYLSHGWHRYVGRFPPQVIRSLINAFRIDSSHLILDPFSGSGTALVEAKLMGIDAIGFDICPLSHLISEVKVKLDYDPDALSEALTSVENSFAKAQWRNTLHDWDSTRKADRSKFEIPAFPNVEKWFNADVLNQLTTLLSAVEDLPGREVRKFFYVAVSASMRSIANVDVDVVRTEYRRTPRKDVDVLAAVRRKVNRMVEDLRSYKRLDIRRSDVQAKLGDARRLALAKNSVDFVVTSPPYGIEAVSYLRTHMLSYRVLRQVLKVDVKDLAKEMIGTDFVMEQELGNDDLNSDSAERFFRSISPKGVANERRVAQMVRYFQDMKKSIGEISRVLKDNRYAVIIIGDKRLLDRKIPTHEILVEMADWFGLSPKLTMPVKLVCNNPTAVTPWSERMIKDEYILALGKT